MSLSIIIKNHQKWLKIRSPDLGELWIAAIPLIPGTTRNIPLYATCITLSHTEGMWQRNKGKKLWLLTHMGFSKITNVHKSGIGPNEKEHFFSYSLVHPNWSILMILYLQSKNSQIFLLFNQDNLWKHKKFTLNNKIVFIFVKDTIVG